jgi:hypothetical protein
MGAINLASLGLAIGAMGQFWFYGRLLPQFPRWVVWGFLLLPWVTASAISICNRAPFGPRPFRLCLVTVMVWYALVTLFAELMQAIVHLPADGHFPISAARILMYFGFLSFVMFIRVCITLRRYEPKKDS